LLHVPQLPRFPTRITQNCSNAVPLYKRDNRTRMEIKVPPGDEYRPPDYFAPDKLDWQQYEAYVFGTLERMLPGAKITRDVHLRGVKTVVPRQVDILVERDLGGFNLKIAIDCKSYGRRVNVNDVERFLGMLDDIRVSKGVLMTTKGYSKAAWNRAQNESRDIELHILAAEQLSRFHSIGCAILWNGPVAALVSPPDGWAVDNEQRPMVPGSKRRADTPQFTFYPLGHTRDSAVFGSAFMYGKIVLKWREAPTMEAIAAWHEQQALQQWPTARFERLPAVQREGRAGSEPEKTLLRVGHIHSGYKGPEYSLYIDHAEGVLLLVLFCPEGKDAIYLPLLKWIGEKALMLDCTDRRRTESNTETIG
jgi:hypothetical protein